jgi:hypothetical protein
MGESENFNEITLFVTHYNSSMSLERLLKSFKERQIRFKEIVISEDGSKIGIEKWAPYAIIFFQFRGYASTDCYGFRKHKVKVNTIFDHNILTFRQKK